MVGIGNRAADKYPEECPICHFSIKALMVSESITESGFQGLQVAFRCPRHQCQSLFVATYRQQQNHNLALYSALPMTPIEPVIPENVKAISADFVKVYGQAEAANSHNLDQIYGVGLRKALEFLIKDYSCSLHPTAREEIIGLTLSQCIKTKITDSNIKLCAERAAWLGNDETHYIRKWSSHDISDLKTLIKLTVNWISNELLTKAYMASMPTGKK